MGGYTRVKGLDVKGHHGRGQRNSWRAPSGGGLLARQPSVYRIGRCAEHIVCRHDDNDMSGLSDRSTVESCPWDLSGSRRSNAHLRLPDRRNMFITHGHEGQDRAAQNLGVKVPGGAVLVVGGVRQHLRADRIFERRAARLRSARCQRISGAGAAQPPPQRLQIRRTARFPQP